MKSPLAKIADLLAKIVAGGIVVIVVASVIEFLLLLIAVGVGIVVWIVRDFWAGLASGFLTFIFGQFLVCAVIEFWQFPERPPRDKR